MSLILPGNYESRLDIRETEIAIKKVKDYFERALATSLNLTRVSAPLFVDPKSGMNDNLNGVERPVDFDIKETGVDAEVVHSLAKWKRHALKYYGFHHGEGLYCDMSAIRRDEDTDNLHSIYVDQWDWERVIDRDERNERVLEHIVKKVYDAILKTEDYISLEYHFFGRSLPTNIKFITSQELVEKYPDATPKEREYAAAKEYGAIFLEKIGGVLSDGKPHDGRAPDYDDWALNGDITVYYPVLDMSRELQLVGIRVDEVALKKQLEIAGCPERAELPFQKAILEGALPYSVGGGIGQSRLCLFFLKKAHIGEVQSSLWPEEQIKSCEEKNIHLL